MITINGTPVPNYGQKPLSQYLEDNQYDPTKIAVELNGNIVPKKDYATTILNDNDILEVVTFVGGG